MSIIWGRFSELNDDGGRCEMKEEARMGEGELFGLCRRDKRTALKPWEYWNYVAE